MVKRCSVHGISAVIRFMAMFPRSIRILSSTAIIGMIPNHAPSITKFIGVLRREWLLLRFCRLLTYGDICNQGLHQWNPEGAVFIVLNKTMVFLYDASGRAYSTQQRKLSDPQFWVRLQTTSYKYVGIPLFTLCTERMVSKVSLPVLHNRLRLVPNLICSSQYCSHQVQERTPCHLTWHIYGQFGKTSRTYFGVSFYFVLS